MPYRQVVNERLLGPVGLARTTWTPVDPVAVPYLVDPFADAVSLEPMLEDGSLGAAGELWSTAVDVARWGAFLGDPDPDVLSPAAAEEMRTVHAMAETDRWTLGWGAGLWLIRQGERVWPGTAARCPASSPRCLFRPQERLSVAVVTNSGARADPDELALALGEKELESRPEPPAEWRPSPPPEDVVPLLGVWWSEGYSFTFSWRGGRLEARLDARPAWRPPSVFERVESDLWRTVSGRERGEWLRVRRDEHGSRRPPELGGLSVHSRAGAVRAEALGTTEERQSNRLLQARRRNARLAHPSPRRRTGVLSSAGAVAAHDRAGPRGRVARRGRARCVHVIDHPDARVLVDTGMTELYPAVADLDPRPPSTRSAATGPRRCRSATSSAHSSTTSSEISVE